MVPFLSLISRDYADWGDEPRPDSQTEKMSVVEGMRVDDPLINIPVFNGIVE